MRVLQLGPFPPPEGGVSRNLVAIRDYLLANGHECPVGVISRSFERSGMPEVSYPAGSLQLLKFLFTEKYDLVHLHIGGGIPLRVLTLVFCAAMTARGKAIMTLHSGGYARDRAETAKAFSLEGFVFRRLARIICVNEEMKKLFGKFGVSEEKIRLILPFALRKPDANVEVPKELADFAGKHSPFLFSASLLEDEYGLDLQIGSMERVLKEFPNAGLMIAGAGSQESRLRDYAAGKGYADRVFFAGNVSNDIVLHLIDRCDMLLRTTIFDGDAISIREALFLEAPVVATDNGMRPEGVKKIPIGGLRELEEAIIGIAARGRQEKKGKEEDLSNISEIVDLYREVLTQ